MSLKPVAVAVAAALALCSVTGLAQTQDERKRAVEVEAGKRRVSVNVDASNRDRNVNRKDKLSKGISHRASEIQGMSVENDADKELGTVKDIVIDVREGQVKYAALSYGGFLGLGDKLFAVPWNAFEHRHDASEDEHTLVLGINEETLKNAPGFDQSEWPNFADPAFSTEVEKHYGRAGTRHNRQSGVNVQAGPVAVDVDVNRNRDQVRGPASRRRGTESQDVFHRSEDLIGMTVKNTSGNELGSVNDLVIDMNSGQVRYAALSYGGFLGLGDKLFAVPWGAFDCRYNSSEEEYQLILGVDETTLRKAPGFDQDNWPDLADPKFGDQIDTYYGETHRRSDRPTNRSGRTATDESIRGDEPNR